MILKLKEKKIRWKTEQCLANLSKQNLYREGVLETMGIITQDSISQGSSRTFRKIKSLMR